MKERRVKKWNGGRKEGLRDEARKHMKRGKNKTGGRKDERKQEKKDGIKEAKENRKK